MVAPLQDECTRLYLANATLWEMLKRQTERAVERESLLLGQWAAWERRALLLEQLGWEIGAWQWLAWWLANGQRGAGDVPPLQLQLTMHTPTCTVVEVPHPPFLLVRPRSMCTSK
jgi:hypothetical protein